MNQLKLTIAGILLLMSSLAQIGCKAGSTYPSPNMTGTLIDPTMEPLPTLMAKAIRFAHIRYGEGSEDFAINLPEGTPHEVYSRVIRKLGGGHPQTDPAEPAYHILEIRSKRLEAEVDIIYPREGSIYELVTISLSRRLVEGWVVLSSRLWRTQVRHPGPNYVPPTPLLLPPPEGAEEDETMPASASSQPDDPA